MIINLLNYYAENGCTITKYRDVVIVSRGKPYMVAWYAARYRRMITGVDDTRKLRMVQRRRALKLHGRNRAC